MTNKEIDDVFKKIFPLMTPEEQNQHLRNCFSGSLQGRPGEDAIILMGSDAINRLYSFKTEMVQKYHKNKTMQEQKDNNTCYICGKPGYKTDGKSRTLCFEHTY